MAATVKDLRSKAELDEVLKKKGSAVLHFWASWCAASSQMDAVMSHLCTEHPKIDFFRVEAEEVPDITEAYSVSAVPFFVFIKNGAVADKLEGANPADLAQKISHLASADGSQKTSEIEEITTISSLNSAVPANGLEVAKKDPLEERLKGLVASKPVMLFMKGSPDAPRCGFSRKVVEILKDLGVEIGSFDILADENVRQGLKTFSNWPTYPQLYVDGEFIGGCDIVTEMHKSGELKELFTTKGLNIQESIESRLKRLINSSPTMLFMKGTPEAPRCGFSSKVVNALQEEGISFGSFDILSDNEIREGLKKYANWPTYPQLYHKGELIGGCDIILELKANGELKAELA
ncbi:hypothetical protein KP509_32G070700 [Ceratopteris richardii]|uniref:Thioredoxin domain-containing protein n=2 Tax=Ceratopteris richardii TaxID=49495 RepID=A0A8T2QUI4_CERRI|nr:hypothetical protein KP509_32G070700 [Ceratopteris richardii]